MGGGDSLCPSARWRLKADRCLDTVPRLNDWSGMEGGIKVDIKQVTFHSKETRVALKVAVKPVMTAVWLVKLRTVAVKCNTRSTEWPT